MAQESFDKFFVEVSAFIAQRKSKDESTKVGAVIVGSRNVPISFGWNGFPRNVRDTVKVRHERPQKYQYTEHAERNAIYNAQQSLEGATLYLNYAPCPCTDCARAIIQTGISHVIGSDIAFPGKGAQWEYDLKIASQMLKEANVSMKSIPTTVLSHDIIETLFPFLGES